MDYQPQKTVNPQRLSLAWVAIIAFLIGCLAGVTLHGVTAISLIEKGVFK